MPRFPAIHHCTPTPLHFFGRAAELALLDNALAGGETSVAAMIGPGGQGKTAIVQHWLSRISHAEPEVLAKETASFANASGSDGIFFWSFYRGKNCDLCLREMLAYAEGLDHPPDVSASYCVDKLLSILIRERWALVLDGTEVVQHEQGVWFGRFVHPELGRLLEELASVVIPGVVVLTSRFSLPTLEHRRHAKVISLSTLDEPAAVGLLASFGVRGDLTEAARAAGFHAKAVELLGAYLHAYRNGDAAHCRALPTVASADASDEENYVTRVLCALQAVMPQEMQDILALATSFRQPASDRRLIEYLHSESLRHLLHDAWRRAYEPFATRATAWLREQVQTLVTLRLLERVAMGRSDSVGDDAIVLDAHPLVRRGFEHLLGGSQHHVARSRAGFLRGRPDRHPPLTLDDCREEVELFHAYCDAGLWNEADSTFVALDNPKHRFLSPAFERDLLLRFFPNNDWRQPPLWPGFGRYRSLAICFEMLGQFGDAIEAYRPADAPLRGDALIALGRLQPFVDEPTAPHPWQTLWQAYRAHALALLGRRDEAWRVVQTVVPMDVYEWVHVFECLHRIGKLATLDLNSMLYRAPMTDEHRWGKLARERMRLDYVFICTPIGERGESLGPAYRSLIEAYDQSGMPFERVLTRLRFARWLLECGQREEAAAVGNLGLSLCRRFGMTLLGNECRELAGAQEPRTQ